MSLKQWPNQDPNYSCPILAHLTPLSSPGVCHQCHMHPAILHLATVPIQTARFDLQEVSRSPWFFMVVLVALLRFSVLSPSHITDVFRTSMQASTLKPQGQHIEGHIVMSYSRQPLMVNHEIDNACARTFAVWRQLP